MRDRNYINGQWVSCSGGRKIDVVNPATEEIIHAVPRSDAADVALAVAAARRAFDEGKWPGVSFRERAAVLRRIAEGIRSRLPELARLEVLDNGKPLPEAEWDIADAAGCFDFYAGLAEEQEGRPNEQIVLPDDRFSSEVVREPVGVIGAIIPWNYPMLMASWKVAPALAAGCTMVLKPSELTSLTALELCDIADKADLPAGVLNVVTGLGAEAGQALSLHPGVDKLAFTGSVPTGSKIMAAASQDIKRVSLELGGKSPLVVFEDADIDKAVEWIMFGIFWNQGQVCSATSRVLISNAIYDRLVDRLIERASTITTGNGLEKGILLGPLVSAPQQQKVLTAIERAKQDGATILLGGKRPAMPSEGFFVEPTILANVPLDCDAWREEIFGPVVCVRPFSSEAEAVMLANDSRFGLAAAVMSADKGRATRVAKAFRAGIVWINCSQPTFSEAPWGGYKQSGIGRELGRWGFANCQEVKQVTRYLSNDSWDWYLPQ